jgi:hypothetical protein
MRSDDLDLSHAGEFDAALRWVASTDVVEFWVEAEVVIGACG